MVTELCYLGTSPCLLFKDRKKLVDLVISFSYPEKYQFYLLQIVF